MRTITRRGRMRAMPPGDRKGLVLLVALICLLLVSVIGASLLKTALAQRRQAQREQLRLQADWLAEAGLERAAAKLRGDGDYRGEVWNLSADELGGGRAGRVTIEVETIETEAGRRAVSLVADYPQDTPQRARSTKRIFIEIQPRRDET